MPDPYALNPHRSGEDRRTAGIAPMTDASLCAAAIGARIDRLPATRSVWQLVVLLSLGMFFELYELLLTGYVASGLVASGILQPTTPGLFGTSGVAAFIASLFMGLFIGTIACGFLADRFGRRAIFTGSLLWYTAASVTMAFQHDAPSLELWRFVAGLGLGVEMVTIGAYLAELAPRAIRGRAFALSQAIGFSAVPVVAFLAWLLVPRAPLGLDGWRWVVLLGACGAIVVWWIRRALPESPRWLAQQGRLEEAERIVTALELAVARESGAPLPPAAAPGGGIEVRARFRELWRAPWRRRVLMMSTFNIFQTLGYYGFANWVPTLLVKQGITLTQSLFYTALIALAAPVGPLVGLAIADRLERKHVIVACAGVIVACGLLFAQARSPAALVALGLALTVAQNVVSFTYHTYQAELFPTRIRARAVGFVYSWSRLSTIFTAFVIAFVLERAGVSGVFALVAGAMLVVMLVIGLLGPRTRGRSLEHVESATEDL